MLGTRGAIGRQPLKNMNTFLKTLAIILAAATPLALSAESLGVMLPAPFDTSHAFGAFVIAFTLLTMSTDYRSSKPLVATATASVPTLRSELRLAA